MADETKTQIPKPTRQRGPMGRIGGMRRGEKAKDFKGTMRQLLGYIGQHKIAVFTAVAFAVCSVIFNIVGPKYLARLRPSCSRAWLPRSTAPAMSTLPGSPRRSAFCSACIWQALFAASSKAGS